MTSSGSATGHVPSPSASAAASSSAMGSSAEASSFSSTAIASTAAVALPSNRALRPIIVSQATVEAYKAICENDTIAARIVQEIIRIVDLLRGDGSDSRRMKIADDFIHLLNGISKPHEAYMFVKRFAMLCRKISQRRKKVVRGCGNFTHFSGKPRRMVQVTKKHALRPRRNVTWNQPYVIGRLNGHHIL